MGRRGVCGGSAFGAWLFVAVYMCKVVMLDYRDSNCGV